ESFTAMTSALTATCAGKPHPLISGAATTAATPMCLSNRPPRRRRRFARKLWKNVRLKPSATMAKAEGDRTKCHDEFFPQDIAARSESYLCAFYGLSFGENKPHLGSYHNGWQAGSM